MAKTSRPTVTVGIYRSDQAAEHNSPRAWKAHRLRAQVFDKAVKHPSLRVAAVRDMHDEHNTHEFADAVVEILQDPSTRVVLTAAGLYAFKHLTRPLDDWVEAGVKRLYKSLFGAFRKSQISEFFISLPNGDRISAGPDARITVSLAGGKVTSVKLDISKPRPRRVRPKRSRRR